MPKISPKSAALFIPKHKIKKIPYNATAETIAHIEALKKASSAKKRQLLFDAIKRRPGTTGPTGGVRRFFEAVEEIKMTNRDKLSKLMEAYINIEEARVEYFENKDKGTIMRFGKPMIGKKRKEAAELKSKQLKNIKGVKTLNKEEYDLRKKAARVGSMSTTKTLPRTFVHGKKYDPWTAQDRSMRRGEKSYD